MTALCQCGCGLPAPIAERGYMSRGWVKGQPMKYRRGHAVRARYLREGRTLKPNPKRKPSTQKPRLTAFDRFWPRVDRRGPNECWNWTGSVSTTGYGHFTLKRHTKNGAHRAAWELTYGPVPEGLLVCHSCDNRRCCNPSHLFLGTHRDNMQDMIAKGRGAWQKSA